MSQAVPRLKITDDELGAFLLVVLGDVDEIRKLLEKDDRQVIRRSFIRVIFSGVEGVCFILKQHCLDQAGKKRNLYTPAEMAVLREENYYLSSDGEVSIRPNYPSFEDNIKFTLRMFCREVPSAVLSFDGQGWGDLKKAIQVRHRITHPKRPEALKISNEELRVASRAYVWFTRTVILNMAVLLHRLHDTIEDLVGKGLPQEVDQQILKGVTAVREYLSQIEKRWR